MGGVGMGVGDELRLCSRNGKVASLNPGSSRNLLLTLLSLRMEMDETPRSSALQACAEENRCSRAIFREEISPA